MINAVAGQELRPENLLKIAGITSLSTVDYPDNLSAVVFTRGCNLRCRYCHNPELMSMMPDANDPQWEDVLALLTRRSGLLDAVVFSGGEPILQQALLPAIQAVKQRGFKVGLHTAGQSPSRLESLIPWLDWVGLDIKGLPEDYPLITGATAGDKAWRSQKILQERGINFEVRTTVNWSLLSPERLLQLAKRLSEAGVTDFVVQRCRDQQCFNGTLPHPALPPSVTHRLWDTLSGWFPRFTVR
ncbi:anaerobic ribonucleoside-triphosphate reductase activating protein [Kistimonas scapharcae]|uniref:Anaerobic ribonucleoside-triphosphate reductase activating protein n=1 Tax=Kistimonas scapharcae TaxID=1036133 RepID=A0ABP8VCP0_9GAMM